MYRNTLPPNTLAKKIHTHTIPLTLDLSYAPPPPPGPHPILPEIRRSAAAVLKHDKLVKYTNIISLLVKSTISNRPFRSISQSATQKLGWRYTRKTPGGCVSNHVVRYSSQAFKSSQNNNPMSHTAKKQQSSNSLDKQEKEILLKCLTPSRQC